MKKSSFLKQAFAYIFCTLLLNYSVVSQNNSPEIANFQTVADTLNKIVLLSYDLDDSEEQTAEVTLRISSDGGASYLFKSGILEGDVGENVKIGKGKKIYWKYTDDDIVFKNLRFQLTADDGYEVNAADVLGKVNKDRLKENVTKVYGYRHHESAAGKKKLEEVKNMISSAFDQSDIQLERQKYKYKEWPGENIIGKIEGYDHDGETYIICARFDSSPESPGADDNASGVSGMMEIAKILSDYTFKKSIIFLGLDMQIYDFRGARQYIANKGIKKFENIAGAINLDMIGYYSDQPESQYIPTEFGLIYPKVFEAIKADDFRGNFVLNVSNGDSRELSASFVKAAATSMPALKVRSVEVFNKGEHTRELAASDHVPFWYAEIPAIHLGDGGPSRNPFFGTEQDTPDRLNYSYMADIVQATMATILELAEVSHASTVDMGLSEYNSIKYSFLN